jgi:hypothetical protein
MSGTKFLACQKFYAHSLNVFALCLQVQMDNNFLRRSVLSPFMYPSSVCINKRALDNKRFSFCLQSSRFGSLGLSSAFDALQGQKLKYLQINAP